MFVFVSLIVCLIELIVNTKLSLVYILCIVDIAMVLLARKLSCEFATNLARLSAIGKTLNDWQDLTESLNKQQSYTQSLLLLPCFCFSFFISSLKSKWSLVQIIKYFWSSKRRRRRRVEFVTYFALMSFLVSQQAKANRLVLV